MSPLLTLETFLTTDVTSVKMSDVDNEDKTVSVMLGGLPSAGASIPLCGGFLKRKPGPKGMAPISCLLAVDKNGKVRNAYKGNP